MHIAVLHQYYLLPGRAGGSRFNAFARLWADAGHRVSVVAGALDYSTGEVPAAYRGQGVVQESDGPVQVYRCPVPTTYAKGYAGRAWAYAGFTAAATRTLVRLPRPDVIVASSPPLPVVAAGMLGAVRHGAPWVFEMRDLWPESAITTGVLKADGAVARLLYALERRACAHADCVCVLTPAFATDLARRQLAPPERVVTVPNGADAAFRPGSRHNATRRALGWDDRCVFLYAGAHGRANALDQLVEAAVLLRHRRDILIACVGDGPTRSGLQAKANELGLSNLRFYGSRPKADMPELVNACDVGVAVLQDNPTFATVYPNKIFDYMACARPVLLGIDGIARNLVCSQAGAGVFARPQDAADLARQVVALADAPARRTALGQAGRAYVTAHLSRDALAARYLQVLQAVAARRPLPEAAPCAPRRAAP